MLNNTNQDKKIITIGIVVIFLGIVLLSSNYLQEKKDKAFETINFDLFKDNISEVEDNSLSMNETLQGEVEHKKIEKKSDYTTYYIGYIEIPKIHLKKGFVDKKSRQNNVEQNVTIVNPSSYPNIEKGNFILAAHSGNGYVGYFRNLYQLKRGDKVYIQYEGIKYTYQIKDIYEQPKKGTIQIYRDRQKTVLTLITCTNNNDKTQTVYIAEQIEKK